VDSAGDSEEAKQATEAVNASTAIEADVDLRHGGRRSVSSARKKAAGQLTTQTRSARPPARSSFPHVTSRTHNCLKTSQCTSRSTKELNTRPSTTKKAGEKRRPTVTRTTTTTLQPCTSNSSSLQNSASQIKHSCTTSLATTFTIGAHCQHRRRSSSLRTDTRDLCIKASCLILALLMYPRLAGNNTSR
jgi:hypothetical protein